MSRDELKVLLVLLRKVGQEAFFNRETYSSKTKWLNSLDYIIWKRVSFFRFLVEERFLEEIR